jgi:hypothetical protein
MIANFMSIYSTETELNVSGKLEFLRKQCLKALITEAFVCLRREIPFVAIYMKIVLTCSWICDWFDLSYLCEGRQASYSFLILLGGTMSMQYHSSLQLSLQWIFFHILVGN